MIMWLIIGLVVWAVFIAIEDDFKQRRQRRADAVRAEAREAENEEFWLDRRLRMARKRIILNKLNAYEDRDR